MQGIRSLVVCAACVAAAPLARASTWTVDDDGPADFSSIVDAIAAAAPGDTLLVAPGQYQPFTVDKRLKIIGGTGPVPILVTGTAFVTHVPTVVLAGLRFEALRLVGINGFARLDDCVIEPHYSDPNGNNAALVAHDCPELLVTRCTIDGGLPNSFGDSPGVELVNCSASLTICSIHGSDSGPAAAGDCGIDGLPGVTAGTSTIRLTACTLLGGSGGITGCFSKPSDGWSAPGLDASGSLVDLRSGTSVAGGPYDPSYSGIHAGLSMSGGMLVTGGGTIGLGGLKLQFGAQQITTNPAEPTLAIEPFGSSVPGGSGQLHFTAPPSAPIVLLVSLTGGLTNVAAVDGALWLTLPAPILLSLPPGTATLPYVLPDDEVLIATTITLQAVFPTVSGALQPTKMAASAPDQIIVRF